MDQSSFQKVPGSQLVEKSPTCYGTVRVSREAATCPYSEPNQLSLCCPISVKIYNIIHFSVFFLEQCAIDGDLDLSGCLYMNLKRS
jgi:hypothetical protein